LKKEVRNVGVTTVPSKIDGHNALPISTCVLKCFKRFNFLWQKEQKLGISPATSSTGSQSCQWESTISKRKMEETETTHLDIRDLLERRSM